MTVLEHEVAVLRPRPGDVLIVYANPGWADPEAPGSAEAIFRLLNDCRARGILAIHLPTDALVVAGTVEEMRPRFDAFLAPYGLRAVPR